MHRLDQPHQSRRADRPAADHGLLKPQRFAIGVQEQIRRGRGRGGFPTVKGDQDFGFRFVMEQEGAAADPGTLRFDQIEHELRRDRRIRRAAARAENLHCGLGRERMGGADHEVPCRRRTPIGRAPGRRLGRHRLRPSLRRRHRQTDHHQRGDQSAARTPPEICRGHRHLRQSILSDGIIAKSGTLVMRRMRLFWKPGACRSRPIDTRQGTMFFR